MALGNWDQNEDAWEKLRDDLNAQIEASNEAKGAWMDIFFFVR